MTRLRMAPGQLISSPNQNPPIPAEDMVVGPGVAPGPPACRAGVVTGLLADESGCRGGIRTYISPLNRRLLYC